MKFLKPDWVNHNGKPIFSIDVHPDGSRFATGGQGEDGGIVIIWNVGPVINEKLEADFAVPRMLCQMDDHTGCVNCLRWSTSGKYLASGGDDKLVMIWELSLKKGSSTLFGTGGTVLIIENWICVHVLRGHVGDILDLAWSPDDSYIATGSVDNTINIWNAQSFPLLVHTIKGHNGLVKGVTFDPVGKYLASQADDKTLCIWNVSDWSLEKKFTEPFIESSGTTHVLRLNWSPDGQYVVSAHAMNNGGPVAKIIQRNGWKSKMDFVGHRKAVTCVRFNDQIFFGNESKQYVACAIGSRDRSLSIWLTSLKRPLLVMNELFQNSIMDISWSKCGYFVFACSLDGTVAFFNFSKEELGKVLSLEEKYNYHKKTFGTSIKATKSLIISSVLENPEFHKFQKQKQQATEEINEQKGSEITKLNQSSEPNSVLQFSKGINKEVKLCAGTLRSSSLEKSAAEDVLKKQSETKTKDGKRRIVPMLVEPHQDYNKSVGSISIVGTSLNTDKIEVTPSVISTTKETLTEKLNNQSTPLNSISSNTVSVATSIVQTPTVASTVASTVTKSVSNVNNAGVKRKAEDNLYKKSKKKKERSIDLLLSPFGKSNESLENTPSRVLPVSIPALEPEKFYSVQVNLTSFSQQKINTTIEVENQLENLSENTGLHFIRCFIEKVVQWETCVSCPINGLVANEKFVGVACIDCTVHVFSQKGRRLFPPLIMDSKIAQFHGNQLFLLVITKCGLASVWNTKTKTIVVNKESLLHLLKDGTLSITSCFINKNGSPIITLSNHSVYSFDTQLASWTVLSSACDSLQIAADIGSCLSGSLPAKGSLHAIQAPLSRISKQTVAGLRVSSAIQQTCTLAYLENQVCSALAIESAIEYKFWLTTYVRHLVQSEDECRLRDLCEDLSGVNQGRNDAETKSKILCFDKRDLLKDILPVIATNLRFQRFYSEFQHQLDQKKV
ncbi:protein HIRA isoform X2 [Hydra vulgaris]|uniref:Protein HIRA n=1 Tax=Hydra vulgaris TaxID=6087 RepID=A0ABM4CNL3_HYDVU